MQFEIKADSEQGLQCFYLEKKKKKVFINQVCVAYLQIKYDEHHAGG